MKNPKNTVPVEDGITYKMVERLDKSFEVFQQNMAKRDNLYEIEHKHNYTNYKQWKE